MPIGDGAPITVQSMTTTKTADVDGTLAQIYALAAAGADIVRCTCNEEAAAEGLAHIVPRSPVPIVADIHFHHEMALAALEAGVQGLRLNPGNLRKEAEIKQVAAEARDRGVPIRIGVNAGSLHPDLYKKYGGATPEALVESARNELALLRGGRLHRRQDLGQGLVGRPHDRRLPAGLGDLRPPAAPRRDRGRARRPAGLVKGTAGIGTLLAEGIGDTIRYSLTADPVEEARAGRQLLESLGLRERKGLDLIACPSCGRAQVDVIAVAKEAQEALEKLNLPIQVAVMGCVVNGPGEAREADIGIAAGKQKGHLFIRGKIIRVVPEAEMVQSLVDEAERLVAEGVEARIAAADSSAEAEAEADRRALIDDDGRRPQPHGREDRDHPPPLGQRRRLRCPANPCAGVSRAAKRGAAMAGVAVCAVVALGAVPLPIDDVGAATTTSTPPSVSDLQEWLMIPGGAPRLPPTCNLSWPTKAWPPRIDAQAEARALRPSDLPGGLHEHKTAFATNAPDLDELAVGFPHAGFAEVSFSEGFGPGPGSTVEERVGRMATMAAATATYRADRDALFGSCQQYSRGRRRHDISWRGTRRTCSRSRRATRPGAPASPRS